MKFSIFDFGLPNGETWMPANAGSRMVEEPGRAK
jgi:hypothetical protein